MHSILITGSDRGLGLEWARQFAADQWRVFATRIRGVFSDMTAQSCRGRKDLTVEMAFRRSILPFCFQSCSPTAMMVRLSMPIRT